MFNEVKKQIEWNGEIIKISTGKIARQALASVMVEMGNTVVHCVVTANKKMAENASFFPFTVNYQEKFHAVGKIPGGFIKREGKGGEKEVLVSRLIDRSLRPLFESSFMNEVSVLCNVHSFDPNHSPDILALLGTSAALAISGLPYTDIASASRVGFINNEFVLNPSLDQLAESKLELVVAGTKESVMMVESEAEFLTEEQMLEALKFGHNGIQPIIKLIEELKAQIAPEMWEVEDIFPEKLKKDIAKFATKKIQSNFEEKEKLARYKMMDELKDSIMEKFTSDEEYSELQVISALDSVKSEIFRKKIIDSQVRVDGRKIDDIRPIDCEVSIFPKTHGSALFTRGETQSIVTTTLGTTTDEQIVDGIEGEYREPFLLNYIFPSYSVGEVGSPRAPSRREIGHGKLAWRALKASVPVKNNDFPYTIRVVSEITESNGSSSMATVCGASMSMMNAGVPLLSPISGIAMGLIKEGKDFTVLSDIIADEDHLGDMDFKVAGSADGITALQMDIKINGINFDIMSVALEQAKKGRLHILDKMSKAISKVSNVSDNAPCFEHLKVNKDKIRDIIGPGGKVIKEICEQTSAKIDISDDGDVTISAVGKENVIEALKRVKSIACDPEINSVYEGKVVKTVESGAFVNIGARDGFVHISEISPERIGAVTDVLKLDDVVKVKVIGVDRNKIRLTIKNADKEHTKTTKKPDSNKTDKKKKDFAFNKKKWNDENKVKSDEESNNNKNEDVTERKYFN